jgi:probable F420-dependent oxidoreductase
MGFGFHLPFDNVPLAEMRPLLEETRDRGYTDVWTAEADNQDGLTPLAMTAAWVPELRLGTAVLPVYTRGPALLAMSAATMASAAPGRFVLGLGSSSTAIVQNWNGIPFEEPFKRTRDTLRFLRSALAGERVDEAYDTFTVKGFRLAQAPAEPPLLYLAALRPGMLRLAGREADGVILNWLGSGDVPQMAAEVGPGTEIVAKIFVCVDPDPEVFDVVSRRLIASYMNVTAYAEFQRWLGRGDALTPMWEAWAAGDRKGATKAIPDEVIADLFVTGTAEQCRAKIQAYADAGATTPLVMAVPGGLSTAETMRRLAPDPA